MQPGACAIPAAGGPAHPGPTCRPAAQRPGVPGPVQAVGHPQALLVTHRLDQCTEGLLVLGKTRAFVASFNELIKRGGGNSSTGGSSSAGSNGSVQADRGGGAAGGSSSSSSADGSGSLPEGRAGPQLQPSPLRKFYRAAMSTPPPLGLLRHYLSVERRHAGGLRPLGGKGSAAGPASLPAPHGRACSAWSRGGACTP